MTVSMIYSGDKVMGVADTMQFIPLAVMEADPACQPKVMKAQVFCASKLMGSPEFYPQSPREKKTYKMCDLPPTYKMLILSNEKRDTL